jgi:hypothetical protein
MKTMKQLLNEFRTWQKEWDTTHKGMNAEDFCASLEEKYEVKFNTKECTFYPTMNTSSATICGACGKEKFEHNL